MTPSSRDDHGGDLDALDSPWGTPGVHQRVGRRGAGRRRDPRPRPPRPPCGPAPLPRRRHGGPTIRRGVCCCCGDTASSPTAGAGRSRPGRSTPASARSTRPVRETREETGWRPLHLEPLAVYHPSNGLSDQRFHLFLATGARSRGPAHRRRRGRTDRVGPGRRGTRADRPRGGPRRAEPHRLAVGLGLRAGLSPDPLISVGSSRVQHVSSSRPASRRRPLQVRGVEGPRWPERPERGGRTPVPRSVDRGRAAPTSQAFTR